MTESSPTALELGEAFRTQQLDPVEWVDKALVAAEDSVSVFISLDAGRARREAAAAAARIKAGRPLGPLDGVPLAWKDLFDVAGSITTVGSRVHATQVAATDAASVRHALGAGLVTFGKTNLSELAYSGLGLNPHYGTPHHTPGDGPARVPGGSSSGSAVAVAKGLVPAAIGTDTGGSLRIPAAFNGLTSYRPSQARHDQRGMRPLASTLDTLGVIAKSLADCLAVDDSLRGSPIIDRGPAPSAETVLIIDTHTLDDPQVCPVVRDNLLQAAEQLRAAGFVVVQRPVDTVRATLDTIGELGWLGAVEAYAEHRALLETEAADQMDRRVRQRIAIAHDISPDTVVVMYRRRLALIESFRADIGNAILITPTVGHVAPLMADVEHNPEHFAEINLKTLRFSMVGSLLDSPAVALPSGRDDAGQFTGLQLSAGQGNDEYLLRGALSVAQVLSGSTPF